MTAVMSFWPSVFERIKHKEKFIEYRRTFPKDGDYVYMYVTKPVKAICAVLYFGKKYTLEELKEKHQDNPQILKQIDHNPKTYQYGAEIVGFEEIEPITLDELRKNVPNFVAPQSYLLLKNNQPLSEFIKQKRKKLS